MKIRPSIKRGLKELKEDDRVELVPTWTVGINISEVNSQEDAELIVGKMLKAIGGSAQETLDAFMEKVVA